jgi:hypothetical protein
LYARANLLSDARISTQRFSFFSSFTQR